jgi:threonine dehydratase
MDIRIDDAAAAIAPWVRRTPVVTLAAGSLGVDVPLVLKLESMQRAGSFKARGAFTKLLLDAVPAAGVAAASGGNHGVAVAHAARALGVRAEIFLHSGTAPAKRARVAAEEAVVHLAGASYAEAEAACRAHVAAAGALWVPAYDDPLVVAGQGTAARELWAEAPVDTLLIAVGGGGLIGGCAAWLAGRARVVGIETRGTPTLHEALRAGRPVDVEIAGMAADALGARRAGAIPFEIAKRFVDRVVLVDDEDLVRAQRRLWSELRLAAELASASGLAALLAGAYRPAPGERVGIIVCGGNVDPASLGYA